MKMVRLSRHVVYRPIGRTVSHILGGDMGCRINQNQINSDTVPYPRFLTYSLKLSLFAAPFDRRRNAISSHLQSTVKTATFDQIRPLYSLEDPAIERRDFDRNGLRIPSLLLVSSLLLDLPQRNGMNDGI